MMDYLIVGEVRDGCRRHARSPGHACERITTAENIDFIV
jgi:hypothetical protein